jgi:predicted PurR-regulated permease PerM
VTELTDHEVAQPTAGRSAKELRRSARLLVIGSGLLILIAIAPVAAGLAGAVTLYEICKRPYARLVRRVKPRLAGVVIAAGVLVLGAAPLVWLGYHLSTRLPSVLAGIDAIQKSLADSTSAGVSSQIGPTIAKARSSAAEWLPSLLKTLGGNISWALLNWSIALLGLYYLLLSSSDVWQKMKVVLPFSPTGAETLRVRLQDTSLAIVAGTLLSATVQGASIGFGFYLAGIQEAVFWAVCATIATLVPLVGNALVWFPGLLSMIITRNYAGAIVIGIFGGLGPPLIDRVVRSTVSSRMGRVHPMITLVGALAGIQVAGVAGLILGPVALDMFFSLADVYSREYLGVDAGSGANVANDDAARH